MNKTFAVFEPEDRVRMSDDGVRQTDGPRLTGVVVGYGPFMGHPDLLLKVRFEDGTTTLVAPWHYQRTTDGAYGRSPDTALDPIPKPIETHYNGAHCRSRCEARWCVFWDALGLLWEYEKEGVRLKSGPYLPDFWLPQVRMWAEVKPTKFTTKEEEKCYDLATETGYPCLLLDGAPTAKHYLAAMPCDDSAGVTFYQMSFALTNDREVATEQGRFISDPGPEIYRDTLRAVAAARSARFEHGESGMSVDAEVRLRS